MQSLIYAVWISWLAGVAMVTFYGSIAGAPRHAEEGGGRTAAATAPTGQFLLFTQAADTHFLRTTLPQLRTLARREGIELIERPVRAGVPESVTATPALFFRTAAGFALFGGRYTDFSAIENFLRVNRARPKAPAADARSEGLVGERGRQRILVPLKVTAQRGPYAGTTLDWSTTVPQVIANRTDFARTAKVLLWPTDRRYYLDVHPYVAADGTVFLSAAIFSQFDCINPVWDNFATPFAGPVAEVDRLLTQLADRLAEVVRRQSTDYPRGDALTPVPPTLPAFFWSDLPPAPAAPATVAPGGVDLARADRYADPSPLAEGLPMLQFNFPAPLDRYAGEVREMTGRLDYDIAAQTISGEFIARVGTLTMGMAELDAKVLKSYLRAKKYPRAAFAFREVRLPAGYDGQQPLELEISGRFTLIGREEPIVVRTRLQPTTRADGAPALDVEAEFHLDIADPFGLTGPDGPAEIKNQLQFQLRFRLAGTGWP